MPYLHISRLIIFNPWKSDIVDWHSACPCPIRQLFSARSKSQVVLATMETPGGHRFKSVCRLISFSLFFSRWEFFRGSLWNSMASLSRDEYVSHSKTRQNQTLDGAADLLLVYGGTREVTDSFALLLQISEVVPVYSWDHSRAYLIILFLLSQRSIRNSFRSSSRVCRSPSIL